MTPESVYEALGLPPACLRDQRVPKKALLESENIKLTAADKKAIREALESVVWKFALTPETVQVRPFTSDDRTFEEIAVLEARLKDSAEAEKTVDRLGVILHRAIPYPVLLIVAATDKVIVSAADKRMSRAERGKVVADEPISTPWLPSGHDELDADFLKSLSLADLSQSDFLALYADIRKVVAARAAGERTGKLNLARDAASIQEDIDESRRLEAEIKRARAALKKADHFNEKVELNTQIKDLERRLQATLEALNG